MTKIGRISWPVAKTLFHELGHVIDENSREGIKTKEKLQQSSSLGFGRFYEWANTIFERLVNGDKFYKKDDSMQLSEAGYESLANLGSMLSCALGISEIEFAKIKDKGREYEGRLLEEKFGDKDVLKNIKSIFDKYYLETGLSLSKKKANQALLNKMYAECLGIMKKRIETELQKDDIKNLEEYKKQQMFFLKKMNFNYKEASKLHGFRFLKNPTIHDIGFCSDNISKRDLQTIASENIAKTDFGFKSDELNKYSTDMVVSNKKSFITALKVHFTTQTKRQVKNINENVQDYDKQSTR